MERVIQSLFQSPQEKTPGDPVLAENPENFPNSKGVLCRGKLCTKKRPGGCKNPLLKNPPGGPFPGEPFKGAKL